LGVDQEIVIEADQMRVVVYALHYEGLLEALLGLGDQADLFQSYNFAVFLLLSLVNNAVRASPQNGKDFVIVQ